MKFLTPNLGIVKTPYEVFEQLTGINMNKSTELHLSYDSNSALFKNLEHTITQHLHIPFQN